MFTCVLCDGKKVTTRGIWKPFPEPVTCVLCLGKGFLSQSELDDFRFEEARLERPFLAD